ncbi:MAG: site-specific integrase [Actinomycetota bacterium]|nr:site-specific integrase [Actinomycetota bacterium]
MASIRKIHRHPKGGQAQWSWEIRYRDPEGRMRQKTFPTKPEAQRFARTVEVDKDTGRYVDPRLGKVQFSEWAERWNEAKPAKKATTQDTRRRLLDRHILPAFGSKQLGRIRPIDVQEFVTSLEASGLSASRIRNAYFVLKPCIEAAVGSGYIARTPCVGIELPRPHSREMKFLSAEQVRAVADAVPERDRSLIYVLALGGLRWSEAVALRRRRVNLLHRRIEVAQAVVEVNGKLVFGEPKTYQHRSVAMPTFLKTLLVEYLRTYVPLDPDAFVFSTRSGDLLRSPNWRQRVWQPALQAAGVPTSIRIHDLRHTCASLLIEQGAHPKAIQEHLGHKSITTTLDRYGHLLPQESSRIAEALDRSFAAGE